MLTAEALADLKSAILLPANADELVPPPRFAAKTFSNYLTDPAIPAQGVAVARIMAFARWRKRLRDWLRLRPVDKPGLYLDGGFGVGKTHLLAASWHAAHGVRRYLSFAEAVALVILYGADRATALLAGDLVCIDEFELDDPANTRLIDLLLDRLIASGTRIITTSNTVPGELGQGRFAIDQFRNQVARISERFEDVHVPGHDHRRRLLASDGADPVGWGTAVEPFSDGDRTAVVAAAALDQLLAEIPVVNLRRLAGRLSRLTMLDLEPFTNQHTALRFVHLVDKLYDGRVQLRVRSSAPLTGLFPEAHCQRAFAKKYQRCTSRLVELCA
ncbi:MAG: cell division protein ZapE [Planctomycetes bacterium]|nr:cell division protein ZapE [Planctomycetota bacterium]